MTVSLKNQVLFDKPDYAVTVCLISDHWGTYLCMIVSFFFFIKILLKAINLNNYITKDSSRTKTKISTLI